MGGNGGALGAGRDGEGTLARCQGKKCSAVCGWVWGGIPPLVFSEVDGRESWGEWKLGLVGVVDQLASRFTQYC